MTETTDIVIVGAGVLGLCTAVELTRRGHDVSVVDAGGGNASAVAAGMIAPAMEAIADDTMPERAGLMRAAAALWPDFAKRLGIALRPGPSEWRSDEAGLVAARLATLGFVVQSLEGAVETDDIQIAPPRALAKMVASLNGPVLSETVLSVRRTASGWIVETAEREIRSRTLIVATGAAKAIEGLPHGVARAVDAITPIRGQIGVTRQRLVDRVTRGPDVYVVPTDTGAMIGATMEAGRRDLAPDPATGQVLLRAAEQLLGFGEIADLKAVTWQVGIRGASADGLPLAGPTGEAGLHLALAPRRNGWLLGPLVARVVADGIENRARGVHAASLDPRRFG